MSGKAQEVEILLDKITPDMFEGDEVARLRVRDAARRLVARLETPFECASALCWEHPVVYAALQTGIDLGLWGAWLTGGGGEKSLVELVELTPIDCDPNLLRRLLRLLVSVNMLGETGEDRYEPTRFSLALGDKSTYIPHCLQSGTHHWLDSGRNLPGFLAKTGYKESLDPKSNSYTDMTPEKLPFFSRLQSNPAYYESFSGYMARWTTWKTNWTDIYDTSLLLDEAKMDEPLIVDMGGHYGIDLSRVLEKHPDLPAGSLVLQDLPEVIAVAKVSDKIRAMAHDFFTPQPICGSRAYFFHAVFHDWPDSAAARILENLIPAMKRGYSKLFIYEVVLPPTSASAFQAALDVQMMALVSACERTEAMWTKLLEGAGLHIVRFWKDGRGIETLIEAELA